MNIYEIKTSANEEDVGNVPQITDSTVLLTREKRREYLTLNRKDFPGKMPDLNIFKFNAAVKITDVLSCSYLPQTVGLIVNDKVKRIIENHSIQKTRSFEMVITTDNRKETHMYSLLYVLEAPELVDFAASEFYHTNFFGNKVYGKVNVSSAEEFYKAYSEVETGIVTPYTLKLNNVPDLFRLPWQVSPFISESLKDQLDQNEITGLEITIPGIDFIV